MAERRLSLSWHAVRDVTVIRVETSLSSSALDRELVNNKLGEITDQSTGKVVIDMAGMEMLDSRTLATIISLNRKLTGQGGQLRFCNLCPLVQKALDNFGLTKILLVDPTERDSLSALETFTVSKKTPPKPPTP